MRPEIGGTLIAIHIKAVATEVVTAMLIGAMVLLVPELEDGIPETETEAETGTETETETGTETGTETETGRAETETETETEAETETERRRGDNAMSPCAKEQQQQ